jgi:N-acetylmuramoyl-L-alanine amidase
VLTHSGRSIAIELVNDGDGVDVFSDAQLDALVTLLRGIVARHGVARSGMVRHADLDHGVMPCDRSRRRKVDPGDAFPLEPVLDRVFAR